MIEIKIKGPPKSGKTVIAAEIATNMRRCGYTVKVDDGDKNIASCDKNPKIHIYTEEREIR